MASLTRRFLLVLALGLAALGLAAPAAFADIFGPTVQPRGREEVVFDWTTMRCDDLHIPDLPVRALRDAGGRVQLLMPHGATRRMTGPNLNSLSSSCTVVLFSHSSPVPSTYNNSEWLVAPYTIDGQTVYGLVHNEFNGWKYAGWCDSSQGPSIYKPQCLYNALTSAVSVNRGDRYNHTAAPGHLVASIPFRYAKDKGPAGYFEASNIIRHRTNGFYYAMFRAVDYPHTAIPKQRSGSCLMRTQNLADPKSWRAWDGNAANDSQGGFTVRFINPYTESVPAVAPHVCAPISRDQIKDMTASITWSTYFKKYLLVGRTGELLNNGRHVWGVYYSLSSDLIHWSERQLLMETELSNSGECLRRATNFPSLLDPAAPVTDRNFETTGKRPYLYFTTRKYNNCNTGTLDRDLIRIPISFGSHRLATLEDDNLLHPATGYDQTFRGAGQIALGKGYEGTGSTAARLTSPRSGSGPWTSFDVSWSNGTDVWYGSAFLLTNGFRAANERLPIMRWHNSTATPPNPSGYGGVVLGRDDRYRLVRGEPGAEKAIGGLFDLPEGRWFWLEVHQRLGGNAPLSEVFVDGRLVSSGSAANVKSGVPAPVRLQFGFTSRVGAGTSALWLDRSSVSLSQRGALGAPPGPRGFTGEGQDGAAVLNWNPVPGANGYRVYRQTYTGTWAKRFDTTGTRVVDRNLINGKKYFYRLAAYRADKEGIASVPVTVTPTAP